MLNCNRNHVGGSSLCLMEIEIIVKSNLHVGL
jgi:hypothetical protein